MQIVPIFEMVTLTALKVTVTTKMVVSGVINLQQLFSQTNFQKMFKALASIAIGSAVGFGLVGLAHANYGKAKVDNGLMTNVPGYGNSRVETVSFCLTDAGVTKYQDLITDTQVEAFGACMKDNT